MANKPKIRFNGHQDDWEEKKFSSQAETRRGLTYKPSSVEKRGVRVLRSSNISDTKFVLSTEDVFVKEEAVNIDYATENDILITAANGSKKLVGKHCLLRNIQKNSTVHGGFMLLTTAKNPNFLNASMGSQWYKDFIRIYVAGGGGAIGNLNKADLDNQQILIPSPPEQQQIGEFFAALDELIGAKEQELEKLRQMKQALLEKMFPCEGNNNLYGGGNSQTINLLQDYNLTISTAPNTPQIRFRGFTEPWEKKLIKDVCKVNTGDKNTQDKVHNGKYPFYVRSQKVERINSYSYEGEAILTAGDGDIGKIFHYATGKIGVHQRVYMLTDIKCNSLYLYHFFAKNLHRRVKLMSAKNTVDSIRMEMITEMALMIPKNEAEQILIGNFFRAQDNAINAAKEQIQKLIILKQALLDKMFAA